MDTLKGKFFVIDGVDGSGKGTQTKLIIEKLNKEGYNVLELDFPQYGKKSAALVEEYLNGKYGTAEEVTAYQASIFYAVDRFDASKKAKEHLENDGIIIANRYVSSNKIHQSSKIQDEQEFEKFLKWLDDLEYNIFKIPKPDKVIFLNVSPEVTEKLCKQKSLRGYIENNENTDIHESNQEYIKWCYKRACELANRYENWIEIKCSDEKEIRPIEDINNDIYKIIKEDLDN